MNHLVPYNPNSSAMTLDSSAADTLHHLSLALRSTETVADLSAELAERVNVLTIQTERGLIPLCEIPLKKISMMITAEAQAAQKIKLLEKTIQEHQARIDTLLNEIGSLRQQIDVCQKQSAAQVNTLLANHVQPLRVAEQAHKSELDAVRKASDADRQFLAQKRYEEAEMRRAETEVINQCKQQ